MVISFDDADILLDYFNYIPSYAFCYVGMIVFSILFILLMIRLLKSNCPRYMILLPITAIIEASGFILRYFCLLYPNTKLLFTTMSIMLLLPGNMIVMVNYKIIGDLIKFSNNEPRYIVIGPNFTKIFCQSNIAITILQSLGNSLQSFLNNLEYASFILIVVSISAHLILFIGFFFCVCYIGMTPDYQYDTSKQCHKTKLVRVILITVVLVFMRSIYRLVDYISTYENPTKAEEWTFYVFDALLMALCFSIHFIWFVGWYIPSKTFKNSYMECPNTDYNMHQIQRSSRAFSRRSTTESIALSTSTTE